MFIHHFARQRCSRQTKTAVYSSSLFYGQLHGTNQILCVQSIFNDFGATACKTVCPMLPDRQCTILVYCGQTVGWTKMSLATEVDLGPDDIVLDEDPAPPRKGAQQPPLFGPCLVWPNGRPSQPLLSSCIELHF